MAHFPRRSQARSPRRTTVWSQGPGSQTATTFASSTTSVLGLGQTSGGGVTVVRLRGRISCVLETTSAAARGFHCALGIGIASADAFAAGVASLPNPFDDIDWSWWYHSIFDVQSVTATIADGVNAVGAFYTAEVDSKAMRKIAPNETIFASLQVLESGTESMDVLFDSRMLVKLS